MIVASAGNVLVWIVWVVAAFACMPVRTRIEVAMVAARRRFVMHSWHRPSM